MQKVITINLNGNAYQLDESGYDILRAYLARAEKALSDNPDRAEILNDLEQAVADKCQRYLGPHKTVVTSGEVETIVLEMGPVDSATDASPGGTGSPRDGGEAKETPASPPRRLYRIMDGAMVGGVCNGIAAFFRIDVTLIRIAFVIAALVTKGAGVFGYLLMMFVVPEATTPDARAAASGTSVNAKDIVERARTQYAEGREAWRRQWRQQRRQWQQYGWQAGAPVAFGPPAWTAVLLPVFGLAQVAMFLLMAAMLVSLVNTGGILDWQLPPDVPLWAGALILLIGYQIAVAPLRAVHKWHSIPRPGLEPQWLAFWNAVTWLIGVAIVVWIASNNMPEIREFLHRVPELVRDFAEAVRVLVARLRD